jgi:hypothetical protein
MARPGCFYCSMVRGKAVGTCFTSILGLVISSGDDEEEVHKRCTLSHSKTISHKSTES